MEIQNTYPKTDGAIQKHVGQYEIKAISTLEEKEHEKDD